MSFSSLYAGMFTGFILYRSYADHEFTSTVVLSWPEDCVVFISSLILKIFWYFHFFLHDCPWIFGRRWNRCLICDRACLWNVFPIVWAVVRFCINTGWDFICLLPLICLLLRMSVSPFHPFLNLTLVCSHYKLSVFFISGSHMFSPFP